MIRWIPLLFVALAILGCSGARRGGGGGSFGAGSIVDAPATAEISALERKMHARLNRDRQKQGLPPLEFDSELADIARAHSKDMHELDFFSHDSKRTGSLEDRLDRAGYLNRMARENIGEGPDVDGTQDALLESPGHRANIMSKDVTHVGIGILDIGKPGQPRILVTQVFATPIREQDPDAAKAAIAKRVSDARKSAGLRPLPSHPLLDKLAKKHVSDISDDLDKSSAERVGIAVTKELSGSGLSGVSVGASVFLTPELYEPNGAVMSGNAKALGIATTDAKDDRGRPAIKVLFLVGQ
jgi:uncharacterized protein YkwD